MTGRRLPLALAAFLYLALRVAILVTSFDSTALPNFEIYPNGTIAKLLVEGPRVPLHDFYDNAGGQILDGVVTAPVFALFGDSYFVVKCVPLALGLLALLVMHAFVREHFGARAADLSAWLFALSPVTLTKYSVTSSGNHFENLFFTLVVLFCFYRMHGGGRHDVWLALTSLSAGFSLFVFLGAPIVLGLLAVVHLAVRGVRGSARDLAVAAPCFLLGLSPWIYLNARTGGRGLSFLDVSFRERGGFDGGRVLSRFAELVGVHARDAGAFEPLAGIPAGAFAWAFFAAFVAAYAAAAAATVRTFRGAGDTFERWKLVPLLGTLPATAIAYAVSGLHIANYAPPQTFGGYRYLLPHLLVAILIIAIAAGVLVKRRGAALVLAGAALASGLSNLALVDLRSEWPGVGASYSGFSFHQLARCLMRPGNGFTPASIDAFAARIAPVYRHQLYEGLGLLETLQRAADGGAPAPRFAEHPSEYAIDLARGAGRWVRFTQPELDDPAARGLVETALLEPLRRGDPLAASTVEGACIPIVFPGLASDTGRLLDANDRIRAALPRALGPALARGQGLVCGRLLRRGIPREIDEIAEHVAKAQEWERSDLFAGLGFGLADGDENRDARFALPASFDRIVPEASRAAALEGFGRGMRHVYGTDGIDAALEHARSALGEARARAVERGARSTR